MLCEKHDASVLGKPRTNSEYAVRIQGIQLK